MVAWLWMSLISGILQGFCDIFKKKALEQRTVLNVLALYSLFCFLAVSFELGNALKIGFYSLLVILIKAVVIVAAWGLGFAAMKHMPISVITPFSTASPVFSILLGVLVLNERLGWLQVIGVVIILVSYYFIGKTGNSEVSGLLKNRYFYLMIGSAFFNAVSAMIDKLALKNMSIGQMQFWFYLFMMVIYFIALFLQRKREEGGGVKFHYFILLASLILVVSDRIYFHAVNIPQSQISVIMPLRRISVLVSVVLGGMIFREKNLKAKFVYVCLLAAGVAVLFLGDTLLQNS